MDAQLRELTSTGEVIAELGGVAAVAGLTGREYGAAFNWKGSAKFPANTFVVLQDALRGVGCTAPPSLWGMVAAPEPAAETVQP